MSLFNGLIRLLYNLILSKDGLKSYKSPRYVLKYYSYIYTHKRTAHNNLPFLVVVNCVKWLVKILFLPFLVRFLSIVFILFDIISLSSYVLNSHVARQNKFNLTCSCFKSHFAMLKKFKGFFFCVRYCRNYMIIRK